MIDLVLPYEGIIFDLDGTIADTMPLHYQASQEICNEHGFDFPLNFFFSEAGRPTIDVFIDLMKSLGNGLDGKALAIAKEKRFLELLPSVKPVEKVLAVAKHYHNKIPLAIGSGGQRKAVEQTLDTLGITNLFTSIVSADDVTKHKPYPDTFIKCAFEINVDPNKCIVFEDGPPGIVAAKSASMGVVNVNDFIDPSLK
ncbi:MAG: beta-phosphoglucomutase-like phosphatase (HAD superfamily) [Saprospiraceae bacterium]|jgi:beta-phosphoglucomutase-like phosphatase (HAD superfamily)